MKIIKIKRLLLPYIRLLAGPILFLWIAFVGYLTFGEFQKNYTLPTSQILLDSGCSYSASLRSISIVGWPLMSTGGDTSANNDGSNLHLFEDGVEMGPAHSLHHDIRTTGSGKFSHWSDGLLFSSSDCSDPRSNGRTYSISTPLSISFWVLLFTITLAVAYIKFLAWDPNNTGTRRNQVAVFAINSFKQLFSKIDLTERPILTGMLFVVLVSAFVWILTSIWYSGETINLTAVGYYPISDASGYWMCANTFIDAAISGNTSYPTVDWCQRRPIYATLLSGLMAFTGSEFKIILLFQGFIVIAMITTLLRRASPYVGAAGILLSAGLLFYYAYQHAFVFTMSANAGLIFGVFGFAVLIKAAEQRSLRLLGMGVFLISAALNARAGAFFVLPMLVIWAATTAYLGKERIWAWLAVAVAGVLGGFLLQASLVLLVNGDPTNSHSNFSYTIYGLIVGGKGWTQALIDHPELSQITEGLKSKAIYALAWESLLSHPLLLWQGIEKNISIFLRSGTYGYGSLGKSAGTLAIALWWLAWIPMLRNWRHPVYLLVVMCSMGVVASAQLILMDGGSRIFSATVAMDIIQISIGLAWIITLSRHGVKAGFASLASPKRLPESFWVSAAPVGLLLLVLSVPHTPLRHLYDAPLYFAKVSCDKTENRVVTRIGKGPTLLLDIIESLDGGRLVDLPYGEIPKDVLLNGLPSTAWYTEGVRQFKGTSILQAYQHNFLDADSIKPYLYAYLYSDSHLSQYAGHTVNLCVDESITQKIFGVAYKKINSVTILD